MSPSVRYLTRTQLEALAQYKYSSSDYSALDKLLTPYWERVLTLIPTWVAPNLITFTGLVVMITNALVLHQYSYQFNTHVPTTVWIYAALSLWIYQTLDAIDGKQARRTNSSSPLGQLFDHGCDAITTSIVAANVCAALQFQGTHAILCHVFHITSFFVSNWEEFQTGVMRFGVLGVTEAELVHIAVYLLTAAYGHDFWKTAVPFLNVELRFALLSGLVLIGFLLYFEAAYTVYLDSQKKKSSLYEGVLQSLQFIFFLAVFFVWIFGRYSQVDQFARSYMFILGVTFACLISRLIISHVTHTKFVRFPLILWPLLLAALNSWFGLLSEVHVLWYYMLFVFCVYVHYVYCVICAITAHLGIECFRVKRKAQ